MKRIARSLLIIAAVAALAVGATSAVWTDSATVPDNAFTTGTLDISTDPTSAMFTADDIYPGWSETQSLIVSNDGTIPLKYDIAASKSAGDDALYTSSKFLLKIGTTSGAGDIYNGTVSGLSNLSSMRTLAASANETIYFTVSLDSTAGNDLQNLSATVTFTFSATQV